MDSWNPLANKIFAEAIEITDPIARRRFVAEQCQEDDSLLNEIEAMLQIHGRAAGFLKEPAVSPTEVLATENTEPMELVGTDVDGYRILQRIGEGGFGVVYMAQQKAPVKRKVALKVVKPGMDTREVIARFDAERQALALMAHPNIAKVFDAGATASGRPYFVMELVNGVPITEFCDGSRFDTRARLKLFTSVCRAVQHAHQKGIIHRDIKPSNVMVTTLDGEPLVKVIDFGVAKAIDHELTEKTLFTAYGQMIGTPQYMSPEQAATSAVDVDTRSDIYSLGVLLYELLTGATPLSAQQLRKAGYAEVQRIIREVEAPRPSARLSKIGDQLTTIANVRDSNPGRLQKLVRGELDWIVMQALEKDRNRRYESADAFARDIERHINGDAVEACPPSWKYRTIKVLKRNRLAFGMAAILLSTMFAGTLGTSIGLIRASQANAELAAKNRMLADEALAQAFAAAQNNNPERGRQLVEMARELGADESSAQMILGSIAGMLDKDESISHHNRAIALDSSSVAAHAALANEFFQIGDVQNAFMTLRKTKSLKPTTAFDFQFLAQCQSAMSDHANAVENIERSLEIRDSSTGRAVAAMILAQAALSSRDLTTARRAYEYVSEAAVRLGGDHYFILGVRILALDALILISRDSGEEHQDYLAISRKCAEQLLGEVDSLSRMNPGFCWWLASHFEFIENDLEKPEMIYEKLLPHCHGDLWASMYARLLLRKYGVERAVTAFDGLGENRSHFSLAKELPLRALSQNERDREWARTRWQSLGDEDFTVRDSMLLVPLALGEENAMKETAKKWHDTADRNGPIVEFVAGAITENQLVKLSEDGRHPEVVYWLGWRAFAIRDQPSAVTHFEKISGSSNYLDWMYQWSRGALDALEQK